MRHHRLARPAHVSLALFVALLVVAGAVSAVAGELIHADGRHEEAEGLRQGSDGRWTYVSAGRRALVRPGEVAVVVDDDGQATETIPTLVERALTPPEQAALAQVMDTRNDAWFVATAELAREPCRGVMDALAPLLEGRDRRGRLRAVQALSSLHTRESVLAAARAVVAERDRRTQRDGASALLASQEILVRADCDDVLADGVAAADRDVRVTFAFVAARRGIEAALDVLRKDGITHGDHHFRESAAVELLRAGDASGETTLAAMLARSRVPGISADDAELAERVLVSEKTLICDLLAKLPAKAHTAGLHAALEKATRSSRERVARAAAAALDAWSATDASDDSDEPDGSDEPDSGSGDHPTDNGAPSARLR